MRASDLGLERYKLLGLVRHEKLPKKLTLMALNKLKKNRRLRAAELERKSVLVSTMYGNDDVRQQTAELELAGKERELDLERHKLELEAMVAKAEVAAEDKAKISKMAVRQLAKR